MPAKLDVNRRRFLKGHIAAPEPKPVPPGITRQSLDSCTGCAQCVPACPTGIVTVCDGKVALDFSYGECTFCTACADACPEAVFPQSVDKMGLHRIDIGEHCLTAAGITCMACRDACPEMAINMRPRIGGPFTPELDPAACTGCGACVSGCPADAIKAIPDREASHVAP